MSASTRLGQYARLAAAPVAVAGTIAPIAGADIVFDGSTTVIAADGNGSSAATFADGMIQLFQQSTFLFTFPGGSYLATNINGMGISARGVVGNLGGSNSSYLLAGNMLAEEMVSGGNVSDLPESFFAPLHFQNYNNPQNGVRGNFDIGDSGYIGFSGTLDGGQVVYGWVAVSVGAGELTVNGWAYDDAGDSIAAGQIPAPGALGLLGLAAGAAGMRRKRTA